MRRYFALQLKRMGRLFPFVLCVTLVLLLGLGAVVGGLLNKLNSREEQTRFQIALAGDLENPYLQMGMTVMQTVDSTRYSIEFTEMTEEESQAALKRGDISAYVVLPDGFVEGALSGNIKPIQFVTTAGATGLTSLFKNEITRLVTDMVVAAERGVYGLHDALEDHGQRKESSRLMDEMSLSYLDVIFSRSSLYTVEELGFSDGLSVIEHSVSGVTVLFLVLMGLPFAAAFIKKDLSLNRLMVARGYSDAGQLLAEYTAHMLSLGALAAVSFGVVGGLLTAVGKELAGLPAMSEVFALLPALIPVLLMLAAWNLMLFECAGNLVSGVLLHFFSGLCLCYVSGCFYPISTFPMIVQRLSRWLPTGMARSHFAHCMVGEFDGFSCGGLFVYVLLFFGVTLLVRRHKRRWAV